MCMYSLPCNCVGLLHLAVSHLITRTFNYTVPGKLVVDCKLLLCLQAEEGHDFGNNWCRVLGLMWKPIHRFNSRCGSMASFLASSVVEIRQTLFVVNFLKHHMYNFFGK